MSSVGTASAAERNSVLDTRCGIGIGRPVEPPCCSVLIGTFHGIKCHRIFAPGSKQHLCISTAQPLELWQRRRRRSCSICSMQSWTPGAGSLHLAGRLMLSARRWAWKNRRDKRHTLMYNLTQSHVAFVSWGLHRSTTSPRGHRSPACGSSQHRAPRLPESFPPLRHLGGISEAETEGGRTIQDQEWVLRPRANAHVKRRDSDHRRSAS